MGPILLLSLLTEMDLKNYLRPSQSKKVLKDDVVPQLPGTQNL